MTAAGEALGEKAAHTLMSLRGDFVLEPGLRDPEFEAVERAHGFTFADDHRAFLSQVLPAGRHWPDWRSPGAPELVEQLARPIEGVLFDVKRNNLWFETLWGARPDTMTNALLEAERLLREAPRMVPVFGHRYLPAGAGTYGHPILSIVQADVICYGANLVEYIDADFGSGWTPTDCANCTAAFWCDIEG